MSKHQYRGEIVYVGHTGEIFGGACTVATSSLQEAKAVIEKQLTSKSPSVWLRILENNVEVEFRQISNSKAQLPQVASFG